MMSPPTIVLFLSGCVIYMPGCDDHRVAPLPLTHTEVPPTSPPPHTVPMKLMAPHTIPAAIGKDVAHTGGEGGDVCGTVRVTLWS